MNVLCPVCEQFYFAQEDDYDICKVCGWENDAVQGNDHDYWGGANHLTVNESKIYYELSLCEEKIAQLKSIRDNYYKKRKDI